ncbi:MAG: DUF5666 domain-containing protein [Chloroflexota bacterium]
MLRNATLIGAIALGAVFCMPGTSLARHAPPATPAHFFRGSIAALLGPGANPSGFTLQLIQRTVDFRIASDTMLRPRSAEAEVEGFQVGDFAVVRARRAAGVWVATWIRFDVRPWGPFRASTLTGNITTVGPNGLRFSIQLSSGKTRRVRIVPATRFIVNSLLTAVPQPLVTGQEVSVLARKSPHGWLALRIAVGSAGALPPL